MLLFRALNDYDIASNPLENGIASKQMICDLIEKNYKKNNEFVCLNNEDKELFIKEHMLDFLKFNNYKLKRLFVNNSNKSRDDVRKYCDFLTCIKDKNNDQLLEIIKNKDRDINFGSYINFIKHLSMIQRHLLYGSTKVTDWISASTNVESMMKYYDNQKIHNIAIIHSDTNGIFDSDNIMTVDLSTLEKIRRNNYLCNKIDGFDDFTIDTIAELSKFDPTIMLNFKNNIINHTNINARGFKYSTSSKEVCILRYVPKEHILSILESIQIDLIRCEMFNEKFIYLTPFDQIKELRRFKNILLEQLKIINNPYLLYLFEELYVYNRNINDLVSFNQSKKYIEENRNKILRLSLKIPSIMIKKNVK